MQKELLEIEFRYHDRPIGSCPATSCSKTIAIGIFDTLEEAQKAIAKFTEKIQSKVEEVRLCSSGDCEFYVTEVRGVLEYRNNLEIHVRLK